MDRTLVRKDTATLYVRWQRRRGDATPLDVLRVAWWMVQYGLGVIDAQRVAARALTGFRDHEEASMIRATERWFQEVVLEHVAEGGRRAVAAHRERGDLLAIVTGSTRYAAGPLARELGIEHVVCTELEVVEGRFTGRIREPMCYGAGKIELAGRVAREHGFRLSEATFYSDSITDLPLLEAVAEPVVVNPDPRLARVARRRGWRVEKW